MGVIMLLCLLIVFSSWTYEPFRSKEQFLNDEFSEIQVNVDVAYYLSKEGTLYCTGVNPDGATYVVYQNKEKGIVAQNVKSFDRLLSGGCYIDSQNDLYIWNKYEKPLYGYHQKKEHVRILKGVKDVVVDSYCIIYLDLENKLFLIGALGDEEYSIDNPKLLAKNVSCVDVNNGTVIWATFDGKVDSYGEKDTTMLNEINAKTANACVSDIQLSRGYVVALCEGQLWYYGDYGKLITGDDSNNRELKLISSDIMKFSISPEVETIVAQNTKGEALVWGKSFINDTRNGDTSKNIYCEGRCLAKNVENIFVSSGCIGYIDKKGKSNIFYEIDEPEWFGNSTRDYCVGIDGEPIRWISK